MFGFLNVYKPTGMTSHDVVACLRRVTKIKQIGHTGTLDPFAEGVLPICIGKATRLIEYLADDKAYIATVQFGKSTATYDLEGEVTSQSDKKITESELLGVIPDFDGEIEQIPPIYSALKLNGKRLYEYAREGKTVDIKPRKVFIEKIELLSFDEAAQSAEIYIKCSKGTYIRTIGHDIGQKLECGAYLTKLKRAQAGDFILKDAIPLESFTSKETVVENLTSPLEKLLLEKVIISDDEYEKIRHGMPISMREGLNSEAFIILVYKDELAAMAYVFGESIKVKKVFL